MSKSVAVLKITLDHVEPKVIRRIVVSADIRLDRLHLAIQAARGWTNTHLYEFRIGGTGWGEADPDGIYDGSLDAGRARLAAVLADAGRTSATDGITPLSSKGSFRRSRSNLPFSCSKPPTGALPKTVADRRVTRGCSTSSPPPRTRSTTKPSPGVAERSIPLKAWPSSAQSRHRSPCPPLAPESACPGETGVINITGRLQSKLVYGLALSKRAACLSWRAFH